MNFHKENIILLSIFGIIFGLVVFFYSDTTHEHVYSMIYLAPIILCVIISIHISRRYKKSQYFSLGFLFLGISMSFLLAAELTWGMMPYLQLSQYESYPDIFYVGYSIFSLIFPLYILKHYKIHLQTIHYLLVLLIVTIAILSYIILSDIPFDMSSSFVLGLLFVVLSSGMLGISLVALSTLYNTKVFHIWYIIVFSFFINLIADIVYYASENITNWQSDNWVNFVWFIGYLVMIFALGEQRHVYIKK